MVTRFSIKNFPIDAYYFPFIQTNIIESIFKTKHSKYKNYFL